MEPKLIKIDRNGSKHYEGLTTCDRCGGAGYYAIAICNGAPVLSPLDGGACWKCGGTGKVWSKWIERTPEYQAKLDARREARNKAKREQWEAENAERLKAQAEAEAKRKAEQAEREARIAAEKAKSQHRGNAGDKINEEVTYAGCARFKVRSFSGYGEDTMYLHFFKDDHDNKLVWKTSKSLQWCKDINARPLVWASPEAGDRVTLKGTIKAHDEYKDEKQTILTRCKVERSK